MAQRRVITDYSCTREGLTPDEQVLLAQALSDIKNDHTNAPMYQRANLGKCMQALYNYSLNGQVAKIYMPDNTFAGIVLFDVIVNWFTDERHVIEMIVLGVNDIAGTGRVAVKVLQELAVEYEATTILAGNSVGTPSVDNVYLKAGFEPFKTFRQEVV